MKIIFLQGDEGKRKGLSGIYEIIDENGNVLDYSTSIKNLKKKYPGILFDKLYKKED